ncbi:MAG: peptidylprolyl isomerase [Anaerolineales bacterium]|nr:peptidylprolyl isomerase [Anaerolineales bacterium]
MDKKPEIAEEGVVVGIHYKLFVGGELADETENDIPLEYLHGFENIIPGLEKALTGKKIGDKLTVTVSPEEGYGVIDPDATMDVNRSEFPHEVPLVPGVELEMTDVDGNLLWGEIISVQKDTITIDFNHPLAGEELTFEVEIVSMRKPTEEELENGGIELPFDDEEEYDDFKEED